MLSGDGVVVDANLQAARFLGYEPGELVGRHAGDLVAPEHRAESLARLERLGAGEPVEPARRVFLRKDGTRLPGEIYVSVRRDPQSHNLHLISCIRDVTRSVSSERSRAEQTLRLKALGTLAGGIAHDLNNILSSLIGFTDLAYEALPPDSDAARDLDRALRSADQARLLVAQILEFGRDADEERRPVDLEQAVVQVIRLVRTTLPVGTTLHFESDHALNVVMGNRVRLQQVVLNLCANAGKALEGRGGNVWIRLRTERHDGSDYIALCVEDDGPGIPPEQQEWIFEPFFTTRPTAGGTGLGLSVVKGIVDDHHGTIELESEGPGARFRIVLPALSALDADRAAGGVTHDAGAGRRGVVIVLDDDRDFVEIVSRMLSSDGCSVMASHEPEDALQLVASWSEEIDVVITDHSMPRMSGVEFLRRARQLGLTAPAVLVSATDPGLSDEACARLGIAELRRKPVRRFDLVELVRRHIGEA